MINTNLLATSKAFKIKASNLNSMATVIDLLLANQFRYIDDHNSGDSITDISIGYVLVELNDQLCPFPTNGFGACLNPLYVDENDNEVHLSTLSIGAYFPSTEALECAGIKFHIID